MRDLLAKHQIAVCVVLFATVMITLKLWVIPQFLSQFGFGGWFFAMIGIFAWGIWLDRRQPTDSGS